MFKLKRNKKPKVQKQPGKIRLFFRRIGNFKIIRKPVNGLKAIGGYFAGSWEELKMVRWTNRKATWSMTFAVIAFSFVFTALILLLDIAFKELFNLILK